MKVLFVNANDGFIHKASANAALYPNIGLLTLMTMLRNVLSEKRIDCSVDYLDGCVHGNAVIQEFISANRDDLRVVCFSVLTSNYGASLRLAELAKACNSIVQTVFGNDHFSALYKSIMEKRPCVDFGFYGNDIVTGFSAFVSDLILEQNQDLSKYAGLVYRKDGVNITRNQEDSAEYTTLPLIDYSLCDATLPHTERYVMGQQQTYYFMKDRNLRSQIVDVGRGCIKFSGQRMNDVPLNACDFCGIIPGSKAVSSTTSGNAWERLRNAYDQGFNYFYITADELPLTFWPLLSEMARSVPEWFSSIPSESRPKMFGYARAEAFERQPEKIDILVDVFGFDHFFIGFDGLSDISLKVMNKQSTISNSKNFGLMNANLDALRVISSKGCLITAGIVVTHLGITPEIMRENFIQLEKVVSEHHALFAALDFGPLCPIPGSQSFHYFVNPDYARERARKYNLNINHDYLLSVQDKYRFGDIFDNDDMIQDFMKGCCPDIDDGVLKDYMARITDLAVRHDIVVGGGV